MGNKNLVLILPEKLQPGYTQLTNEFIRNASHPNECGQDGFQLVAYLLSTGGGKKPFPTSGKDISAVLGWGHDGDRVRKAGEAAIKGQRLMIRQHVRPDGTEIKFRWDYIVLPGGRKFTDEERSFWSRPLVR